MKRTRIFDRVRCDGCAALCLPEHAPQFKLDDGDTTTAPRVLLVRLCRVPVERLPDGGYGFDGCCVSQWAIEHRALMLTDPYLGKKAPAPLRV